MVSDHSPGMEGRALQLRGEVLPVLGRSGRAAAVSAPASAGADGGHDPGDVSTGGPDGATDLRGASRDEYPGAGRASEDVPRGLAGGRARGGRRRVPPDPGVRRADGEGRDRGCHRIKLRDGVGAMGMEWYHIGKFDYQGVFHVDKEAIAEIIKRDIYPYKICPALNIEKIKRGLSLIPDQINPQRDSGWNIEDHYTGIKRLVPVAYWKELSNDPHKISVGDFNIQMNVAVRTIDYYSSVSPQFKKVMELETAK